MQGTRLEIMLNDVMDKVFERMSHEEAPFIATNYLDKIVIHMLFNMCFGRKCNLDDPEVDTILQNDKEIVDLFANGFFEDIIPFMDKIYTTQRWKKMNVLLNENISIITKEFQEHKKTFDSIGRFSQNFKDIAFAPYSAAWKCQKRVAGKALRYYMQGTRLETMLNDVMDKVFERMAQEKGPFVVNNYMDKIVIHMLFNMCFGRKCNLDDPDVIKLMEEDKEILELFATGFFEDIIPYMDKIYTTKRWDKMNKIVDDTIVFLQKDFRNHKRTFDAGNIRDLTDSILLAHQEARDEEKSEDLEFFTEDHMVQIISNIFFAGLDTSRMTLDWFISCMVAHPECQRKCQEEIDNTLGIGRRPSTTDRPNFSFTEACIMETMRVGSVVGTGLPHETVCDTTVGGYDIPKGTTVFINHWALHNDKKFWKNVDKFDPYRYLDKDGKLNNKPENWLPFSAGRRICLGETVARAEFVLIASNLLQNFTFKAPPGVQHKLDFRSIFAGSEIPAEYKVVIEKRNNC
ncbi:hypothetical protein FSP39_022336 [Pinctada imbricata]|uniref:Steroid 17-alpha-hydroxylase/17,20 lyase n=1 Tax=Pinctada imbricata TaxID=66713 RepID=A0AA88Y8Z0_PINIB|nr:hypothetical protein FSP39_022336 [Pinctada imbricata]